LQPVNENKAQNKAIIVYFFFIADRV
jgi:hypothetical protein